MSIFCATGSMSPQFGAPTVDDWTSTTSGGKRDRDDFIYLFVFGMLFMFLCPGSLRQRSRRTTVQPTTNKTESPSEELCRELYALLFFDLFRRVV